MQLKMKIVLSILLLLITSMYLLPVKEFLKAGTAVCLTDMDEKKEENCNKEKLKDLFSSNIPDWCVENACNNLQQYIYFTIPVPLHTVETPPPDPA